MSISTVMFDLDGTLLPMDNDEFTRGYFKLLAAKLAPRGYEPKALVDGIWAGGGRDGRERRLAHERGGLLGALHRDIRRGRAGDRPLIEEFYERDFDAARRFCGYNPAAAETVALARGLGLRCIFATNPLFPPAATRLRIGWAGLRPEDFELITTYDNCSYCKPNPDYYRDILRRRGLDGAECLMVGNDADEDAGPPPRPA